MKNYSSLCVLGSLVLGTMQSVAAPLVIADDASGFDNHGDYMHARRARMAAPAPRLTYEDAGGPWFSIGPDGGDVTDIGISPADPNLMLASVAPSAFQVAVFFVPHSGVYRSTDSAAHWSAVTEFEGLKVNGLAFASDGEAYAASEDSLWKSGDAGAHWQRLELGIGAVARIRSVAVDPSDDATLWACINTNAGSNPFTLMKSVDAGASWIDRTPPGGGAQSDCEAVAIDASDTQRVAATFNDTNWIGHVWLSGDGGDVWQDISTGLPPYRLFTLAFASSRILVGGGHVGGEDVGVYASDDSGQHWLSLSDSSWPLLAVNALAVAPDDPQTILAATPGRGVNRSTDGGATWTLEIDGTTGLSANALRFAPGGAGRVLLGAMSLGVLDSADGATGFTQTSAGLRELHVVSISVNPANADELATAFQSDNNGGVYASIDHGGHWVLQKLPPTRYSRVGFSPSGVLHAISSGPTSVAQEGLYRRNADATWTNLGPNQGPFFESDIATLLFNPSDPNLILLGGSAFFGPGTIWRSTDSGANWTKVWIGNDYDKVSDFEMIAGSGGTLVASHDGQFPPQLGGILQSTDGGQTWSDSNTGLPPMTRLPRLCQTVSEPPAIYLSAAISTTQSGVFRSDDSGTSWAPVSTSPGILLDIACDPFDPALIYAARNDSRYPVVRSSDGGTSFETYSEGLANFISPNELVASVYGGSTQLLLGSSGSSFVLPAAGDPIFTDGFELP